MSDQTKLIAAALRRMQAIKIDECFDANNVDSVPTEDQLEVFKDISNVNHRYCRGGNQCKPLKSLVKMGDGSLKQLGDIKVGDEVLTFDRKLNRLVKATVSAVWDNGIQDVYRYHVGKGQYTDSTPNHEMVELRGGKLTKREIGKADTLTQVASEYEGTDTEDARMTELLGYLLGDGCTVLRRKNGKDRQLQFTNTNQVIIEHVRTLIDEGYHMRDCKNGDYGINKIGGKKGQNKYRNWIREIGLDECYAHQKFIPRYVFTQSKDTRRKVIGGLIATDGWITKCGKPRIGFSTTSFQLAKDLVELLASVGIYSTIKSRSRNNPNHRDEHTVQIGKPSHYNKFIRDIWVPSKSETAQLRTHVAKHNPYGTRKIREIEYLGKMQVADITVDHPDHNYICDGFITGNSGKSQVLRREVAWMFERKHPYFTPPKDWAEDEPWQILLVGKTRRMLEDSLWSGIRKFLKPGTYKEVKVGPYLEKIEHKENGNTIILLSHDNPSVAVERMQSYTAHYIGLDEMPTSYKVIEELHRRGQAKAAPFLASFTPKSQNIQIKKLVDAVTYPYGKVYKLRSLDNPVMSKKKKEDLLESVKSYSESYQRTILEGDWMIGERAVYQFNPEITIASPPETYHKGWRHIESSDPAVSSKFGFTLWAEDPATGVWYCIRDEYVSGIFVPEKIFQHVQELTRGYNIVKRICDPHETWYINTARSHGVHYQSPFDKNSRKNELIKGLQSAMISEIRIAPWCERLIEELSNCQFREDSDKIVNSSSYHLLDTAQYFVDIKPAHNPELAPKTWEVELREGNKKRKEKAAKLKKQRINTSRRGRTVAQWQRRRSFL